MQEELSHTSDSAPSATPRTELNELFEEMKISEPIEMTALVDGSDIFISSNSSFNSVQSGYDRDDSTRLVDAGGLPLNRHSTSPLPPSDVDCSSRNIDCKTMADLQLDPGSMGLASESPDKYRERTKQGEASAEVAAAAENTSRNTNWTVRLVGIRWWFLVGLIMVFPAFLVFSWIQMAMDSRTKPATQLLNSLLHRFQGAVNFSSLAIHDKYSSVSESSAPLGTPHLSWCRSGCSCRRDPHNEHRVDHTIWDYLFQDLANPLRSDQISGVAAAGNCCYAAVL